MHGSGLCLVSLLPGFLSLGSSDWWTGVCSCRAWGVRQILWRAGCSSDALDGGAVLEADPGAYEIPAVRYSNQGGCDAGRQSVHGALHGFYGDRICLLIIVL